MMTIHDVKDDSILQVSSQEPSTPSKYGADHTWRTSQTSPHILSQKVNYDDIFYGDINNEVTVVLILIERFRRRSEILSSFYQNGEDPA